MYDRRGMKMRKRPFLLLASLVGSVVVAYGLLVVRARPIRSGPLFDRDGVFAIAHRGGAGLWPENTLYAFRQAAALGVDVLEMDVQVTKDGEIVVLHDSTVDRTTNGTGAVGDLTLAELRQLDAGYTWTADDGQSFPYRGRGLTVPTLAEVFTALPNVPMNIEIKPSGPAFAGRLAQLIRDHGMAGRVLIASFDRDVMREFRRLCPEAATAATEAEVRTLYTLGLLRLGRTYRPPAQAVQVPEYHGARRVVTPRFIATVRERNMEVHVWTVNETSDMHRMLTLGVDGIVTDYPDRLLALLGRLETPVGSVPSLEESMDRSP